VVLEADKERRRLRLGIKQLQPTSIDEYLAEHKSGETVSGRVVDVSGSRVKVELGEGVTAFAKLPEQQKQEAAAGASKADLSSLTAMLSQRWKSGPSAAAGPDPAAIRAGQVRSFKISSLDLEKKKIELELQA
jgi:small subunit ribosomal protein S1